MKKPPGSVFFVLFLLAPHGFGQGINIDFLQTAGPNGPCGTEFAPSGTYAAGTTVAATQTGHWNAVYPFWSIPSALTNVAGDSTGVELEYVTGQFYSGVCFDHSLTQGDDEILLDDSARFSEATWNIHGLRPGGYLVYAYAWDPWGIAHTEISVGVAGTLFGPPQQSGGSWPGMQVQGVTYTVHPVTIPEEGSMAIFGIGVPIPGMGAHEGRLNGIQIVPDAIGTTYCTTVLNSSSQAAVLSASGSVSLAANDLTIEAAFLPPGAVGQLLFGSGSTAAFLPGASHCIAHFAPFPPAQIDPSGTLSFTVDFTQPPLTLAPLAAGTTWKFQARFRDSEWRPRGSNLGVLYSDALQIRLTP